MAMSKSPAYQVFLWPGRGLVLSSAIVATPHRHEAVQVTLGLDGPFKIRAGAGPWLEAEAVLLDSGCVHELDGMGRTQANLYVEPHSRLGRVLSAKIPAPGAPGLLAAAPFGPDRRALLALARGKPAAGRAWDLHASLCAKLRGVEPAPPTVDERVAKALRIFHSLERKTISAPELARQVFLSESRLSHLFSEQLGMPVKRYLLWLKVVAACERVNAPDNITQAARYAGFSDGAHLCNSVRRLLGVSPRVLFDNRAFVRIVTGPDPRLA
jgi:AraC-like DNA-binding protein